MAITPQEFERKLKGAANEFARAFNNAPFVAITEVDGAIQQRIFTEGKAADGTSIGKYKEGKYKEKRSAAGRRVDTVDLEFTGDLRRSITQGKEDDKAILRINNSDEQEIAGFLTEKYNKPIFEPSEKERKEAKELMISYVQDEIRKIVASWR